MNISRNRIDRKAPIGNVTIQDVKIVPTDLRFTVLIPSTSPMPITAPTSVCVVETGISNWLAITTVRAAASCAAKPLVGVNVTIF